MIFDIVLYIFLASLLVQFIYYVFIFSKLASRKVRDERPPRLPSVSIVICAHDEEENIRRLLPLLYEQNYSDFEILIVDDRSNDGTYDFLLHEKTIRHNLKLVKIEHSPPHVNAKKYGLTLGIKSAKNELILLTDADCTPSSKEWIYEMASKYDENTKFILGYSQYEKGRGFLNNFIRFETLYTGIQYISFALSGRPYMGVGRNLAYSRTFFLERKGFNNHLKITGGDDDLFVNENATRRITKVAVGNNCIVHSTPKKSFKEFYIQKRRHLSVGRYYRFGDRLLLGFLSLSHLFFWISLIILIIYSIIFYKEPYLPLGGLILRTTIVYIIFVSAAKKLGDKVNGFWLFFMDLLYPFYYTIVGVSVVFSKKIKWK